MKSKENRISLITLDLPYMPDIYVNPMSGTIESFANEEMKNHANALFEASGGRIGKKESEKRKNERLSSV